ncbi:tetratricopeptide repeat protein [Micromonospora thermarum]|uniref:Tetratricopeptide repeat protein n=1 Tax=Micromonospora thermarum TaxID=2720024 RepID=A0ABX0ZHC8_9ACTN|nr:tetratricopeptide repeat protein [Micromonospora thermarum]NJP35280.1 tetratricopeptide repeat protein [Micromonospora thermarum]
MDQFVSAASRAQQAVQASGTQNNYFLVPASAEALPSIAPPWGRRNPHAPLRGRDNLVDRLSQIVSAQSDGLRVHVLYGLGGAGKTRLSLEVAHRAAVQDVEVWWVSAVDSGVFAAGMQAITHRLGATVEQLSQTNPADLVWRLLRQRTQRWLLVIDNADDPQPVLAPNAQVADETGWLRPAGPNGAVLITTRDGDPRTWGPQAVLHQVPELSGHDGGQVLLDYAGPAAGSRAEADALAERLGGLPLALQLAGSYLATVTMTPVAFREPTAPVTFSEYRAALDRDFGRLFLSSNPLNGSAQEVGSAVITQTWELSLALLERRGIAEARPLLRLLSCFEIGPIPYGLLLHVPRMAASPLFPGLNAGRLWQALTALASLSLVTLTQDPAAAEEAADILALHPVVRDTNRAHPDVAEHLDAYIPLVTQLLLQAMDIDNRDPDDPACWPVWQALAPHGPSALHLLPPNADLPHQATEKIGWPATYGAYYYIATGRYAQADSDIRRVLAVEARLLGEEHRDTLTTRDTLAGLLHLWGQLEQSEAEYRSVLAARTRILGEEHPDTLNTRHSLATVLRVRRQLGQAEAEYRSVLAASNRILGEEHPNTLSTRHSLAGVLHDRGHLGQAEAEYRSVLAASNRILGEEHPDTLATRHELASVLRDRGELEQAEAEYRFVLAAETRLLGEEHPATLTTRHNVAGQLHARGQLEQAEAEYHSVLAARRRILGEEHLATLATRHALASVLRDRGELEQAEAEYRFVLAAETRLLGEEHPPL